MIPFVILAIEDENDRAFMTALFVNYERLLYSEIGKLLRDPWAVEDVLQATLVKLIDKLPLLRTLDERSLVNYIITAAKNTARSLLRRAPREKLPSVDDEQFADGKLSDGVSVEDPVLRAESVKRLADIWPLLDERSRYLLEAKYILEMESQEIAAQLGIKPDSVRMELSRARKRAQKLLAEAGGGP